MWQEGSGISNVFLGFRVGCCCCVVGEYPTSNINAINADLLEVAKLDNVMELQFLDRCISCYSRIRDQNATTTVGGEIINSKRFISTLA